MATSLQYCIYRDMELKAKCAYVEDAAALVAVLGKGHRITVHGVTVWREGGEEQSAAESYDHVAEVVYSRLGGRS